MVIKKKKMTKKVLLVNVSFVLRRSIGSKIVIKEKYSKEKWKKAQNAVDKDDLVLCLFTSDIKKEKEKREFGSQRMLRCIWRQILYALLMVKLSICPWKSHRLATPVPHFTSPIMILVFMASPRSINQYSEVCAICLPPKWGSFAWKSAKVMAVNGYTSVTYEVLHQGWCEPVFPDMQIYRGAR